MTITYHIDPGAGGAYSDGDGSEGNPYRSAYYAAVQRMAAFNAGTEDYEFRCKTGLDLNGNTSNGAVFAVDNTSATPRTLLITVHTAGDRHTGVRGTGYRFPTRVRTTNSNTNVTVRMVGISAERFECEGATGTLTEQIGCFSFDSPSGAAGMYCGGGTLLRQECAVIESDDVGYYQDNNTSNPTVTNANCLAVACAGQGFYNAGGSESNINCYSGGNGTAPYSGTITHTNCQHSSADVITGSTASIAWSTANFTNVTAGAQNIKLPSGSALIGAGVGPASNANVSTADFEGDPRSGATTDVGPDQRVVAGGISKGVIAAYNQMMGA